MGQMNERCVSNDKFFRSISDKLDVAMGWDKDKYRSRVRRVLHGLYHGMIGVVKGCVTNWTGSKAEFKRAKWQFSGVIRPENGPKDTEVK